MPWWHFLSNQSRKRHGVLRKRVPIIYNPTFDLCYFYLVSRKETLSKLPPQTLNVHMTSQTLIFLLALYSCTASASGSHSLDHHQTPPGAGLMSLSSSLFPFCSCFSTDQFIPFSVQTCSFFNFFPPLPLFRGTAGKSFF